MITFIRTLAAEFRKMKHSGMLLIHLLVPFAGALLFLMYYRISTWDDLSKINAYYEVVAAAYPLMIAIVVGISVGWEEENNFQRLLSSKSRTQTFAAKFLSLYLMGLLAAAAAVAVFQAGFGIPGKAGSKAGVSMIACLAAVNVSLYLIHLFLTFRFGRTASILTALTGSVAGMLMLTGLGEGLWQFIPYSMAGRMMSYVGWLEFGGTGAEERALFLGELGKAVPGLVLWTLGLAIVTFVWFYRWEGHDCYE